jgi:3-dehydroquinate synthase
LSAKLGTLPATEIARVERAVEIHQLPVRLREPLPVATLLEAMFHDKKVRTGKLRFVILNRLGEAATRQVEQLDLVEAAWREVGAR